MIIEYIFFTSRIKKKLLTSIGLKPFRGIFLIEKRYLSIGFENYFFKNMYLENNVVLVDHDPDPNKNNPSTSVEENLFNIFVLFL